MAALNQTVQVPAGTFNGVVRIVETTPLEPGVQSIKLHAPDVGLIQDDQLLLVSRVVPA